MKENSHFNYCKSKNRLFFETNLQFVPESAPRHYAPDNTVICQNLDVELKFEDLNSQQAKAIANITVAGIGTGSDTIVFNAKSDSIKISSIIIDENQIDNFDHSTDKLIIPYRLNNGFTAKIKISYLIDRPKSGLHWITKDPSRPQRPLQIWTQGESEEARYWLPCIDAPLQVYPTKFIVSVPKNFEVLSNGNLIEKTETEIHSVFTWFQEQPHPAYLITLCIGQFVSFEDKDIRPGVPLRYFADKGQYTAEDLHRSFKETPQMIAFLSEKLGVPFPWVKYHQVVLEDFTGAMENTSATSWFWASLLSKDELEILSNPNYVEEVNLHELAHQWFGDLVVLKHWSSAFLKEGMVTYLTSCYLEKFYGKDLHFLDMYVNQKEYLEELKSKYARPIAYNKYDYSFDLFDQHTYPGGAWRFHMIRRLIGDELWWKTLNYYLTVNRHKSVESADFIKALDEVTGVNFREFFDDWIFRPGVPNLTIQYTFQKVKNSKIIILNIEQTQALIKDFTQPSDKHTIKFDYDKLFDLKFEISWLDINKQWHHQPVHVSKQLITAVSFPVSDEPKALYINSNLDVLMDVDLKGISTKMNKKLAENGPDALARFLAFDQLIEKDLEKEIEFLSKILLAEATKCRESFGLMLEKIGSIKSLAIFSMLETLLEKFSQTLPILALILQHIGQFETPEAFNLVLPYLDHENVAIQTIAIKQIGLTQASERALPLLKDLIDKPSWNYKISLAVVTGLSSLHEPAEEIVITLLEVAEQSKYHFAVRKQALKGITKHASLISKGFKLKLIPKLEKLLNDPNEDVKIDSVKVLSNLKAHSSRHFVEQMINNLADVSRAPMERYMRKYGQDDESSREIAQLRKDIVSVSKENKELKERLVKLETIILTEDESPESGF